MDITNVRGLNLSTGEIAESPEGIREAAMETVNVSRKSIGEIDRELKSRMNTVKGLQRIQKFRTLSKKQQSILNRETAKVEELQSEMAEARQKERSARSVARDIEREQTGVGGISFSPLR